MQVNIFRLMMKFVKAVFTHRKSCCRMMLFCVVLTSAFSLAAQETVSMNTILDSSVRNSPALKSSNAAVSQQRHLLKSAINLPSPEILLQNPTGHFYTLGVQQILDFPTVYGAQRKIQKENIRLAETTVKYTLQDVKYKTSVLYTELQYQHQVMALWKKQDSFYNTIAAGAERANKAGTIDFVQAGFARLQADQAKNNYNLAKAGYAGTLQQLKILSGIAVDFVPDSLEADNIVISVSDTGVAGNALVQYNHQQVIVSEKKVNLEKQKALPGFTVAYLNQGEKNTILQNRFYAGLRIPLWFWQYSGNIAAAKDQVEVSRYNEQLNLQQLTSEMQTAYLKYQAYAQALEYYRTNINNDVNVLTGALDRFYTSGITSYADYLRNLNEANDMRKNYLETVKNYNQTITYIRYLNGTL